LEEPHLKQAQGLGLKPHPLWKEGLFQKNSNNKKVLIVPAIQYKTQGEAWNEEDDQKSEGRSE
jgi:hypothetical protein